MTMTPTEKEIEDELAAIRRAEMRAKQTKAQVEEFKLKLAEMKRVMSSIRTKKDEEKTKDMDKIRTSIEVIAISELSWLLKMTRMSISVSPDNELVRRSPFSTKVKWKYIAAAMIPVLVIAGLVFFFVVIHESIEDDEDAEDGEPGTFAPFEVQAVHHSFDFFDRENESKWSGPFSFVQLFSPNFENLCLYAMAEEDDEDKKRHLLFRPIQEVNDLNPKPRFALMKAPYRRGAWNETHYRNVINGFLLLVAELDPDIGLVLLSDCDHDDPVTGETVKCYKEHFGDDHFDFVVSGVKFIVTNSNYDYGATSQVAELVEEHESWLELSLREGKRGDYKHLVVLRHSVLGLSAPSASGDDHEAASEGSSSLDLDHVMGLTKLASEGVDYVLTYQGHKDVLELAGHDVGASELKDETEERKSTSREDNDEAAVERHQRVRSHERKKSKSSESEEHESHHDHQDHLDKSHGHHHIFYKTPPHVHGLKGHKNMTKNFLDMKVVFSGDMDEDEFRVIWVFEDHIEEQVIKA